MICEQVKRQADAYRTTTTHSRPARSKPGVPSRNLQLLSNAGSSYHSYYIKPANALKRVLCPCREPALEQAINFTVFIKNSIHFPKFKVLRLVHDFQHIL